MLTDYPSKGKPKRKKDLYRNIFCYSTETGKLLWIIDPKNDQVKIGDDAFVTMAVVLEGYKGDEGYHDSDLNPEIIVKDFNLDRDDFTVGTFSSGHYKLNPRTGKIKFLYQGK